MNTDTEIQPWEPADHRKLYTVYEHHFDQFEVVHVGPPWACWFTSIVDVRGKIVEAHAAYGGHFELRPKAPICVPSVKICG
jgi:hypothetical protein